MGLKEPRKFSKQDVLTYIQKNKGIIYRSNQLARVFKVKADAMRPVLAVLVAEESIISKVITRGKVYFLLTDEQIQKQINQRQPREFKHLGEAYIRAMSVVYERCFKK